MSIIKILLIEDNPGDQVLFKEALKETKLESELIIASNAFEAQRELDSIVVDLIVADIIMPGMSGGDLVKKLKSDKRAAGIPIIFLSGMVDKTEGNVNRTNITIGDEHFTSIGKPVAFQDLKNVINSVCFFSK